MVSAGAIRIRIRLRLQRTSSVRFCLTFMRAAVPALKSLCTGRMHTLVRVRCRLRNLTEIRVPVIHGHWTRFVAFAALLKQDIGRQ